MDAIAKALPGDAAVQLSADFPRLAGTHLPMNNPALELTKMLCHVLALDPETDVLVGELKSNLLKLIQVRLLRYFVALQTAKRTQQQQQQPKKKSKISGC